MIPYGKQTIDREDIKAVLRVLKSDFLTQGPEVGKFEENVARYCGARYAVAVANGTAALHLACLVAGVHSGDEVITSPLTFLATANAALYCGAKPRFVDIDSKTLNLDPLLVSRAMSRKTRAVVPVHLSGWPCDMQAFYRLKKSRKLIIIEDACHALGSIYRGKPVGSCSHSDMCVFSFHPLKSITTGEGGLITTNDKALYHRLLELRSHGVVRDPSRFAYRSHGRWYHEMQTLGFNYRLTDIQAALGLSQMSKLSHFVSKRNAIADFYRRQMRGWDFLELPAEVAGSVSAQHLFVIRFHWDRWSMGRREVVEALAKNGISTQVHYIPVYLQPYYQKLGYARGLCPRAEKAYESILSLPIYPSLSQAQARRVVQAIAQIYKKQA